MVIVPRSPARRSGRARLLAPQHLAGERQVGHGAGRGLVVDQRRQTVARRFGEAHIARNDGAVDLVAEVLEQLPRDVVRQVVARVEHGAQQALDLERRIQEAPNLVDGLEQRGQPLQREIFALSGDHHRVRRHQRVDRQHVQRRRAIDDDVGVALAQLLERMTQAQLAPQFLQQPDFGAGQVSVPRQQVIAYSNLKVLSIA